VCEGLFAVGNILNFTRLFHLLAISELLGPMLISLERMIKVRPRQILRVDIFALYFAVILYTF